MATEAHLTVCCLVAGAVERVAAMLGLLRDVADEIVVALDDRSSEDDARFLAGFADVVVPYPYAEPVDRPLPWLVGRCSGRWVLVVDDDEVPSRALLDALPALVRADDVTHYWLTRRWLFPDARRWLDDHPWRNDFQLRLVLRDPRVLRFPDETHRPIVALGPSRHLDLPLYHADCLLKPLEQRLEKARKYERLRPGKRLAGGPMNHVLHLPERRPGARLASVPPEDLPLVDAALAGTRARGPVEGEVTGPATRAEIDAVWAGRPLADDDYRARLEPLERDVAFHADEHRVVSVAVENEGTATWPWGEDGQPEIRLGYRWLDADGASVGGEPIRTAFPGDVAPGARELVPVHVVAPPAPGRYRLVLDLVHERVRWFGCEAALDVEVRPSPGIAVAGDHGRVERTLRQLDDERPGLRPLAVERPVPVPPRFGPPRSPDLQAYLFAGAPRRRPLWTPVLAARTAALLRTALRRRRGRPSAPLPRGADELLDGLAGSDVLLIAGADEAGTWTLWERATLAATARLLGCEVALAPGALPPADGAADRALAGLVRRLAR